MSKTVSITGRAGKMKRRSPDCRMRPTSGDGRDNITRQERGAQVAMLQPMAPHAEAEYPSVGGIVEGRSKRGIRSGVWLDLP